MQLVQIALGVVCARGARCVLAVVSRHAVRSGSQALQHGGVEHVVPGGAALRQTSRHAAVLRVRALFRRWSSR